MKILIIEYGLHNITIQINLVTNCLTCFRLVLQQLVQLCVVVRASASQSVDLGFIPLVESYQKTLKNGIRSFLLGARHLGEVVENKPASSLVVSLGKALNGTPHLYVEDR